jgi:large subunit ribosomal protein L9
MKVILLEDVENLGKKWDVKEVADGYARNFLIPQILVKPASSAEIEQAEKMRAETEAKAQKELAGVEKTASQLDGYELKIPMQVGEDGQLYAAVNSQKISSVLGAEGFKVSQKQIKIAEPIKELGEFPVMIEFDHGLEVEIRVIVEAENG